ncbi:hypothetical protein Ahy_B10g105114 [Arachis hypogaea]|uniref:Uncharacterized protein n=1 Tax=Arachis hypogaea TaxID=3818 RepID=A0A444X773_ARAHY|nr:hypothetical protein Ahy_B10g105114 [Arachis hypogaea]
MIEKEEEPRCRRCPAASPPPSRRHRAIVAPSSPPSSTSLPPLFAKRRERETLRQSSAERERSFHHRRFVHAKGSIAANPSQLVSLPSLLDSTVEKRMTRGREGDRAVRARGGTVLVVAATVAGESCTAIRVIRRQHQPSCSGFDSSISKTSHILILVLPLCFKIAVVTRIGFGTVVAAAGFVRSYCCCEKGKRNLSRLRNSSSSGYLRICFEFRDFKRGRFPCSVAPNELEPFKNFSSQLAALDFIACATADVFSMTDSSTNSQQWCLDSEATMVAIMLPL